MSQSFAPDKWVLIRVVGPRVPECFKILAGWTTPDPRMGEWTFTTAIVSAAREGDSLALETASQRFLLAPLKDVYAFTVKTAAIFVKMHRIAENNGMTFHVVDDHSVLDTLQRYWKGDESTRLPDELS